MKMLKPRVSALDQRTARPAQVERIRGRRGVDIRARNLARDPLCAHCTGLGFVTLATVVDHVVPLWKGGADTDENKQNLCDECHKVKSAAEARERMAPD